MDRVKVKIEQHQIIDDNDDKMLFDGEAIFNNDYVQVWLMHEKSLINYLLVKKITNQTYNLIFHQTKTQALLRVGKKEIFNYPTSEGMLNLETILIEGLLHDNQLYLEYELLSNSKHLSINILLITLAKLDYT